MSRPNKLTVDYFSHDANASSRKTLTILFNHFGHDGISAWWQLLERLADTPNHFIDIRNVECFEYLAARLRFNPERAQVIFSKMADLDAIDKDLYAAGIIWSQNLIERLSEVYKKRNQSLPSKPVINNTVSDTDNSIDSPDNTTNKSKLNKTKENNIKEPTGTPSDLFDCCFTFNDYQNLLEVYPDKVAFLVNAFKKLHSNAPDIDLEKCGGRLAGMYGKKGKDAGYILKVIWDTASIGISGSHFDYIDAVLFKGHDGKPHKNLNTSNVGRDTRDPSKFTRGNHGSAVIDAGEFAR
jgi:hypothetical protein